MAERMRRITACAVLLDGSGDHVSDALYAELVIALEAFQGDDLMHASTYTNQETALKYVDELIYQLQDIASSAEKIAQGIHGWQPEDPGQSRQDREPQGTR